MAGEDLTKLGSFSALSLLANSAASTASNAVSSAITNPQPTSAIPNLMIAGGAFTVAVAAFIYSEHVKYESKKHKEKIEQINELHKSHLKRIEVSGRGTIDGFPPIFQQTKEGKYESLQFNKAEVEDIGKRISNSDVALLRYQECIRSALSKLKEYYDVRMEDNDASEDITISVIAYLLYMIDTKCMNFSGYEYDIAYLGALIKFINAYASSRKGEHTQHFSRMKDVFKYLAEAQQELVAHKEALSLKDTVSGLMNHCISHTSKLIKILVKMFVPGEHSKFADTANHDQLKEGVLRNHYVRTSVLNRAIVNDKQIKLPSCIFNQWIKNLATYHLDSLSGSFGQKNEAISYDFFDFLRKADDYLAAKAADPSKKQDKQIHEQLVLIASVFANSDNFISSAYRESDNTFHVVKEEIQLVERSKIMANFAKLIDINISLQYLSIHLTKSIKQLGEIYVQNPSHFNRIFCAIDLLCHQVEKSLATTKKDFLNLQKQNKFQMQLVGKESFPNEVSDLVDDVAEGIRYWGQKVKECRDKAKKAIRRETIQSVNYDMLKIVETVLTRHHIVAELAEQPANEDCIDEVDDETTDEPTEKSIVKPAPGRVSFFTQDQPVNPPKNLSVIEAHRKSLHLLNTHLSSISAKIMAIVDREVVDSDNYSNLYTVLVALKDKATDLCNEDNKSTGRLKKAEMVINLSLALAEKIEGFLDKTPEQRQKGGASFVREIQRFLNEEANNELIDTHYNSVSQFIYTHICSYRLFKTDTRQKLMDFEEACSGLIVP